MASRPLSSQDIAVGRPLPWAIHDRNGKLLLKKGEVIRSEDLLRAVLQRGLVQESDSGRNTSAAESRAERPTDLSKLPVFRRMRALTDPLERTLLLLQSEQPTAVSECLALARTLREACAADIDAALAAFQIDASDQMVGAAGRALHIAVLCELLGRAAGIDEDERDCINAAALTHDIGMYPLADALNRQKTVLNDAQRQALGRHTVSGCATLQQAGVESACWLQTVRQHHERIDGSGYPAGIAGEAICLGARLVAIADIYTAMIRPRAYREAIQTRDALRQLFLERGKLVDESLAEVFIREIGLFPPGTLVRLEHGQVAVVVHRGESASTPQLRVLLAANGQSAGATEECCAAQRGYAIAGVLPVQKFRSVVTRLPELWERRVEAVAAAVEPASQAR